MLYIFHVDTGTMMTFDMNLAMENVSVLQSVITKACHISEDKQVLLISGGESLDPNQRVAKYNAGMDTNPIFLFSKSTIEAATPPSPSVHYGSDVDLQSQVDGSLNMPPAYETVVSRTQLAVQIRDVDEEEMKACERLVHDQHLQQQGWAAVVANLEDITNALHQRCDLFQDSYGNYLTSRSQYLSTLQCISESLVLLAKIPILDCLKDSSCLDTSVPIAATGGTEADLVSDGTDHTTTLFEWISSQDPHHSLNEMVEQCVRATEQFDEKILDTLKSEVQQTVEAVNNPSMKEVKGLEDRLYGLDQFMSGAKKLVKEQLDMATGFIQNQSRLSNLRDKSILPDLCDSHKKQLQVMLSNHKKLREIKKKCRMAKEELSVNLHTRLRWVMFVEKKICDIDGKLMIYHENLKRLHKRLDILRQIQDAPNVYAELIVEVVRRRRFSSEFLKWATALAKESSQLHSKETKRRQAFVIEIGKHFLQSLFHGFEDSPPYFATEPPADFDQYLPHISVEDIQWLQNAVPELSSVFRIPEEVHIPEQMMLPTVTTTTESVSDSTMQCDARVNGCHPLTAVSSAATSEIDIIQSDCDNQFVHVDNGNISLVDEMAACSPNTDITIKPHVTVSSEKTSFPIPQSLSETLTQEISTEVKGEGDKSVNKTSAGRAEVKGETPKAESSHAVSSTVVTNTPASSKVSDQADGLLSSGEPAKSMESDIPAGERSQDSSVSRKSHRKSHTTLDATSPEMETSQEFQTADFYFDESLPSSMTDSPPNKHSEKDKPSVSEQLLQKTNTILRLEQDLVDSQQKLSSSRLHLKCLCQKLKEDLPSLHSSLTALRDSVTEEQRTFFDYLKTVQQDIVANTTKFHEHVVSSNNESMCKLKDDSDKEISRLNSDLEKNDGKIKELNSQVSCVQKELDEARNATEVVRTEMSKKCEDLKATYSSQKEDLIREHTLGLEVEMDRLRSEYKTQLEQYELEVKCAEDKRSDAQEKIKQLISEKEQLSESLTQRFLEQKEEIRRILQEEFQEKETKLISDMEEKFEKKIEEQCEKNKSEFEDKLAEESQKLQSMLVIEKAEALKDLKVELEAAHKVTVDQLSEKLNSDKDRELKQLEDTLKQEYELSALKAQEKFDCEKEELLGQLNQRSKPVGSSSETQTDMVEVLTLSEHKALMKDVEEKLREETNEQIKKALEEHEQQHEKQIEDLTMRLQRKKDDAMSLVKTSITADRQVQFNEAVSKVSQEKDKIIGELKKREAQLQSLLEQQTGELEKSSSEKAASEETVEQCHNLLAEREKSFSLTEGELKNEIESLKEQLGQCQSQLFTSSIVPAIHKEGACVTDVHSFDKIFELESVLKAKDEEIVNLQSKVMALSMSASTRTIAQNKVSITSCSVGDLVLLCLDERHDQYVVFTIGTTLHFLHTECLELLGLKTGQGESRKSWVLAEIIDKEYCQAKKPQNRFKVPVGTKFYRVKAKPWVREQPRRETASQEAASSSS
ncbi:RB1-inducible coiled-coil protein 1-like isoform X2 [Gigantopelta aegis]|uniref:RB1-inducible coiled-coil protein 1-like isoform X2 n=1 Tax=Gigantopelta aegis TaxID=1735272 RepID=UPI001B88E627|nr:RB1-inducible coiled-coil protein 1-like isoform X2 [Gigantopelta aegis]